MRKNTKENVLPAKREDKYPLKLCLRIFPEALKFLELDIAERVVCSVRVAVTV